MAADDAGAISSVDSIIKYDGLKGICDTSLMLSSVDKVLTYSVVTWLNV